jgi:hypothetical protein
MSHASTAGPSCVFYAADGFVAAPPLALLAPESTAELAAEFPGLHFRLGGLGRADDGGGSGDDGDDDGDNNNNSDDEDDGGGGNGDDGGGSRTDGTLCSYDHVVYIFQRTDAGDADGEGREARLLRKHNLFAAGEAYFVMPAVLRLTTVHFAPYIIRPSTRHLLVC